jgi:hypothetical protein
MGEVELFLLMGSSLKMNLVPILNKTSPRAHMESELEVFGVPKELVKYVVHCPKEKDQK